MEIYGYDEAGNIRTSKGTVPSDPANGDYRDIMEAGHPIPAYVPPPPRPVGEIDQEALNAALAAEGSAFRALALLFLQEINAVRTKLPVPLPAYTQAQLVTALKAKMR